MDFFIFLSNTSFSAILKKAQLKITKLTHVLSTDNPLYRLFSVMLYLDMNITGQYISEARVDTNLNP